MENLNYEKTFELIKAYAELGAKERKIMEYLFKLDIFEGGYSKLAREINMDVRNLRNTLKYLDALGVVNICYDKYINEVEFYQNKNGKIIAKHNNMKACFIVAGWMETLVNRYHDGKIYHEENKKKKFVDEVTQELYKEMEIPYKNEATEKLKYRVGVENEKEHIDYWDYEADEYEEAEARFDSIELKEGQVKYLMNLLTEDILCFEEK